MEFTSKDLSILQFALADARDHQVHILDTLTTARTMSRFSEAIRERRQLLDDYHRLGERLKEATMENGHRCEQCGKPSPARLCSNRCYSAYYGRLEAAATLPIHRDRRAAPPRSIPDK